MIFYFTNYCFLGFVYVELKKYLIFTKLSAVIHLLFNLNIKLILFSNWHIFHIFCVLMMLNRCARFILLNSLVWWLLNLKWHKKFFCKLNLNSIGKILRHIIEWKFEAISLYCDALSEEWIRDNKSILDFYSIYKAEVVIVVNNSNGDGCWETSSYSFIFILFIHSFCLFCTVFIFIPHCYSLVL